MGIQSGGVFQGGCLSRFGGGAEGPDPKCAGRR